MKEISGATGTSPRRVSLELMLRVTHLLALREKLHSLLRAQTGLVKIIGQNLQFLGVNNTIALMFGGVLS